MFQSRLRGNYVAASLALVCGFGLLVSGCGGDDSHRPLTEQDKKNIDDELKGNEIQKKSKEQVVRPNPNA